jgi:hypothetical protein
MPKRRFASHPASRTKKFRRVDWQSPLGFDARSCFDVICRPGPIGTTTHLINNVVTSFREHDPVFAKPNEVFTVDHIDGIYVRTLERESPLLKAQCHTAHTMSTYRLAYEICQILLHKPRVMLVDREADGEHEISIKGATQLKRPSHSAFWVHAMHQQQHVVLKTTTRLSTMYSYIIEAVIHEQFMRRSPSYVPKLIRVAFEEKKKGAKDRLVICSEELKTHKSVYHWLMTLRGNNANFRLWKMLRVVCKSLENVQRVARFTHRDCHCNNVYYDESNRSESVKFIDFDWSSIDVGKVISVPQYLYDTSRPAYGQNRSVDLCVFMRTLGRAIRNVIEQEKKLLRATQFTAKTMAAYNYLVKCGSPVQKFYNHIWEPLMVRYETDSRIVLNRLQEDPVAIDLFKLNRGPNKEFGHEYGIRNLDAIAKAKRAKGRKADGGKIFDYRMAHFEYTSMTPREVLKFLDQNRTKVY